MLAMGLDTFLTGYHGNVLRHRGVSLEDKDGAGVESVANRYRLDVDVGRQQPLQSLTPTSGE